MSNFEEAQKTFDEAIQRCNQESLALSQERQVAGPISAWREKRREVQQKYHEALKEFKDKEVSLQEELATEFERISQNRRDVMDFVEIASFTEEIVLTVAKKKAAMASSQEQHANMAARQVYVAWFCEASGRTMMEGPPGIATATQPRCDLDHRPHASDEDYAKFWLRLGGYTRANEMDKNSWTPLHHAIQATVYWKTAARVCRGLIWQMSAKWLRAKTESGRPLGWTALHMAANGSDIMSQRAKLGFPPDSSQG